jgi:DNA-binding NarL/FixJ family response regulator
VGAYADAETALAGIPALDPAVVLMDIRLPGMSGVECVKHLKQSVPQAQVMMLTILEDYEQIFQSLKAGATGYLVKQSLSEKLVEGVRDLYRGGSPMSNSIARKVVLAFREMANGRPDPETSLSSREQEVLNHLSRGHLYKEIAEELNLSYHTVRTHVQNIYKKLHIRSKSEAARHASSPRPDARIPFPPPAS